MPIKFRDLVKMLKADGWENVHTTGGHYIFKHPTKGTVTVPYHGMNVELKPGTLNSVLKKAGLK